MSEIILGIGMTRFIGIIPSLIFFAICRQHLTEGNKETKDLIYLGTLFRITPISFFILYIFSKIRIENEINTIRTQRLIKEKNISN